MENVVNIDFIVKLSGSTYINNFPINNDLVSSIAKTGDTISIFIVCFLAMILIKMTILIYQKSFAVINSKNQHYKQIVSNFLTSNKHTINSLICGCSIVFVSLIIVCAFNNVFASINQDKDIESSGQVAIIIDETTGAITIQDGWLNNVSDKDLILKSSSLKLKETVADGSELASSLMQISGLGTVLYSGNPNGEIFNIDKSARTLIPNIQETLSFQISNLNIENAKQFIDEPIFGLSFTYAEPEPPALFISGKVINSSTFGHPVGKDETITYEYNSEQTNEAQTITGTIIDEEGNYSIENVPPNTIGHIVYKNLGYNSSTENFSVQTQSITDKNLTLTNPELENYTWAEIQNISEDITNNKSASNYYNEFVHYAEKGIAKELSIPHESDMEDRLFMRIIGINHDDKADGSGKAGLTFMAANAINQGYYFESAEATYTKSWETCKLRANMNNPSDDKSSIYNILNNALTNEKINPLAVIKQSIGEYPNPNPGDLSPVYNSTEKLLEEKFFILSTYEIIGQIDHCEHEGIKYEFSTNDYWANLEGCPWKDQKYSSSKGPLMHSLSWKGYLWLQDKGPLVETLGPGSGYTKDTLLNASSFISEKKSFIDNISSERYMPAVFERSLVLPEPVDFSNYSLCLACNGSQGARNNVLDQSTVAPCFCL